MYSRVARGVLCGGSLFLAQAVFAQETPPEPDAPQIVVEGRKNFERDISKFVGSLAENPAVRQLSRFEQSVCPRTIGFSPAQDEAMRRRMRQVAAAIGIRVGKPDCLANVVVIVTADKRAFLEALRKKKPDYFGELSSMEIRRLIAEPGPATAWQLQGPEMTARGTVLATDSGGIPTNNTTEPASRLSAPTRPQFEAAVVVIEAAAVEGLTTTQIADYATMRSYAGTRPARLDASTSTTILKVLEAPMGSEVPASLTRWDLGFLRGLYSSPANAYAGAQRSAIRKEVARQLQGTSQKAE